MNWSWCASQTCWDGSHQCMVIKLEGDDCRPKCETFFQIANRDLDPWPWIYQTLHSSFSKESSKYQCDCTHILPHLASLLKKHKTPSHRLDNLWKMHAPSWACQSSKLAWQLAWSRVDTKGYSSSLYSSRGFYTCPKPPKYSAYFNVELPLWSFSS